MLSSRTFLMICTQVMTSDSSRVSLSLPNGVGKRADDFLLAIMPVGAWWDSCVLNPFPSLQAGFAIQLLLNYWGESMRCTLATGVEDGIVGSPLWDGELAGNRADVWFMDDFFQGSREVLSVRGSSRAELALWSTNQFGVEGWINTGFPTWSREWKIFLVVFCGCVKQILRIYICYSFSNLSHKNNICISEAMTDLNL